MSQLIREFKSEHVQISDLLLQAREVGVDNQQGRNLILSAKKMLLAHLNKEDKYLYPVLREAAQSDDSLKSTLTDYALDMDKISADVMVFSPCMKMVIIPTKTFNRTATTSSRH